MTFTPEQIATRHMATEVEYINRLLATKDITRDKALNLLGHSAVAAAKVAVEPVTIKYGVNNHRAWFNIL